MARSRPARARAGSIMRVFARRRNDMPPRLDRGSKQRQVLVPLRVRQELEERLRVRQELREALRVALGGTARGGRLGRPPELLERARDLLVGQQMLLPLAAQEVALEVAHDAGERPLERHAVPRRVLELILVGDAPTDLERHEGGAVQEMPERLLVALGVEVEEDREAADLPVHLEQDVLQGAQ